MLNVKNYNFKVCDINLVQRIYKLFCSSYLLSYLVMKIYERNNHNILDIKKMEADLQIVANDEHTLNNIKPKAGLTPIATQQRTPVTLLLIHLILSPII